MREDRAWTWSNPLIGADRDAAAVATRLTAGTSVLVAGARGSGRSHVLRAAVADLRARGVSPIVVRPSAVLADVPLAALEATGDPRVSTLTGHRRADGPAPIVVVDDAQALDDASATAIARAVSAGRATALVSLMVPRARAWPPPVADTVAGRLMLGLWLDGFADRIDLNELTTQDAELLVTVFLGSATLDAATTASLIWRADGSRVLLRELVAEAVQAASAGRDPLIAVRDTPAHSRLAAALELHVADLSDEDRRCLAFIHQVPHIALADVTRFVSSETVQALLTAGLLHADDSAAQHLTANESLARESTRQLGPAHVEALVASATSRMLAEADEWWSLPLAVVVAERWHRGLSAPADADVPPALRARVALDAAREANDRGDAAHAAAHAARGLRAVDVPDLRLEQAFALASLAADGGGDGEGALAGVEASALDAIGRRRLVRQRSILAGRGLWTPVNAMMLGDGDRAVEHDLEDAARAGSALEWSAAAQAATRAAGVSSALPTTYLRALLSAGVAETFRGRWEQATAHFREVERLLDARTRPAGVDATERLGAVLVLLASHQLAGADGSSVRERLAEERLLASREGDTFALTIAGISTAIADANVGRPAHALLELETALRRGPRSLVGPDIALAELGVAEALAAARRPADARMILERSIGGDAPLFRHALASVESTILVSENRYDDAVVRAREAAALTHQHDAPAVRLRDLYKLLLLGVLTPDERSELDLLVTSLDLPLAAEAARRVRAWDTDGGDPAAQLRLHPLWTPRTAPPGSVGIGRLSRLPLPVPTAATIADLTRREREIALLVDEGHTNREIATLLYLSVRTVESHVYQARAKVGATSRADLGRIVAQWHAARAATGSRSRG